MRNPSLKRALLVFLTMLLLLPVFGNAASARIGDVYTTVEIHTYEEYLAVIEAGSVEVSGITVSLPEGLIVFDEITCLGVFEAFYIEVYQDTKFGSDVILYCHASFLAPNCRTTVTQAFYETEEEMPEPTVSSFLVGEQFTDISPTDSGYLQIDKLYYYYSATANDTELWNVTWFKDGCKFCLGWDETTDTSPLFDKLTEEQLGEMEAFREGLLSKANCVSTMEAVDYLPGLLGTGMKIEEDSSAPTGIYEETSAETTSVPAVSEPQELSAGFWVFVGAGIGILAVTITALVLLLRKKK